MDEGAQSYGDLKKCFRYYLPISFQFHHTQMDGAHAGKFLQRLQDVIRKVG